MSHKDPRGIERGKCSKCECNQYEYDASSIRAACCYCDCPAPAHERVDDSSRPSSAASVTRSLVYNEPQPSVNFGPTTDASLSEESVSEISFSASPKTTQAKTLSAVVNNGAPVLVLQPQAQKLEDVLHNAGEEIDSDDIPLPHVLPDYIDEALRSRRLEAKHRSAICRAVVFKLVDEKKISNAYMHKAAKKIRKKYSPMKRATDPKGLALYKKLLRTRDRRIHGPEGPLDKAQRPSTAALTAGDAKENMIKDWAAGKRSITVMKTYVEATRTLREKEASKSKSLDLLINYPALTIPELLLQEFGAMNDIQVSVATMRLNWLQVLPKFEEYYRKNSIYNIGGGFTPAQQTVMVLENIHRFPLWIKTSRGRGRGSIDNAPLEIRASRVLEVFPENTPIAEARPDSKDPLRLSAIGAAMGQCSFFAYSDSEPIFSTEDPIEAVLLLLATYWVFHLTFGPANKLAILFLCACIVGPVKIKGLVARNDKFLDMCRDDFNMEV